MNTTKENIPAWINELTIPQMMREVDALSFVVLSKTLVQNVISQEKAKRIASHLHSAFSYAWGKDIDGARKEYYSALSIERDWTK